jgi:hypothetical protein
MVLRLVSGVSRGEIQVRYHVMDKVAQEQGFLGVILLFPISIIPQFLHTCLYIETVSRRTSGRSLGVFIQSSGLLSIGEHRKKQ